MSTQKLTGLPIKVPKDEVSEIVAEELSENNWELDEIPAPSLVFIPFYTFQFDSYSEMEEEKTKIRNVEETSQGKSSLNAVSNSLDEVTAELVDPEIIQDEIEIPKDVSSSIKNPRMTMDEAKVAAQIKVAAQEKVPRANVHISGMRLVYVPFWSFTLELDEDTTVKLRINAFSGEFEGEESGVPYVGKTRTELARETLSDLKHPNEWLNYIGMFAADVFKLLSPTEDHSHRRYLIIILIIIALLLLGVGFIKLPTPQ